MKLLLDSQHKDALQVACIVAEYQVQFHEVEDKNVVHAYITNNGQDLTSTQACWLGVLWHTEQMIEEAKGEEKPSALGPTQTATYKFGGQDIFKFRES